MEEEKQAMTQAEGPEIPIISLKDIQLTFQGAKGDIDVLQDIDLDIQAGEFVCLLGPSGCGKSTLLRIMAGLLAPSAGEAKMEEEAITGPDWHRGVIFQSPALYPWLTVHDNVAFGLKMRHFPQEKIEELTGKYLNLVDLEDFATYHPYELSGGMKQRAAFARILVNQPRMVLMDEPFGALDALTRQNCQALVRKIWQKTRNTVLMITHDVDEALSLGSRILVMSQRPGRIVKEFRTPFTYQILKEESTHDHVRYTAEYMNVREEILMMITGDADTGADVEDWKKFR